MFELFITLEFDLNIVQKIEKPLHLIFNHSQNHVSQIKRPLAHQEHLPQPVNHDDESRER
jgi:hypothetical protein